MYQQVLFYFNMKPKYGTALFGSWREKKSRDYVLLKTVGNG